VSEIKKLAGQTVWYGLSSVGARMLNYLLTPLLTYLMSDYQGVADYGDYNLLYACIAFANIIFTYGFETGYFRFSNRSDVNQNTLFQTTFGSLLLTSTILFIGIGFFHKDINHFLELADHPEYILWALGIIVLDTIAVIPFAKLRQNNQPRRYAFIKLSGIIVNILFVILFLINRRMHGAPIGLLHKIK
jgi:O-antigen/teichoic acid export membrane protein